MNLRHRAEADVQLDKRAAACDDLALDRFVKSYVGAAETIDRLLGIAHDEQLAGYRPNLAPVPLRRIISREQHQYLGLQRIGVLELVYKHAGESLLKFLTHALVVEHQIAGSKQQVQKIQTPGPLLQTAVLFDDRPEIVAKPRREIRPRAPHELLHFLFERITPLLQVVCRKFVSRVVGNVVLRPPAQQEIK